MPSSKHERAYVRNGVTAWPVEKQREVLAQAGFAGPIYQDVLSRNQLRGRNVEALTSRAEMLRPKARKAPEVIVVASIRVLAMSPVDLMSALAAAASRQATVRALDTGLEIAPDAGASDFAAAASAWDKARRDDQTRDGRTKGSEAAAAAKRRRSEAALVIARPLWGLPSEEIAASEISKRAGLSVTALYRLLGRRTPMQRRAKAIKQGNGQMAAIGQTDLEDFTGPPKLKAKPTPKRKAYS